MKRKVSLLVALLVLLSVFAGCSSQSAPVEEAEAPVEEAEKREDVTIALNEDVSSWDPLNITSGTDVWVHQNVFSKLLTIDKEGNIIPDLAKEYSVSDDGLVYTFKLRDDVLWQDGTKFTADDVIFTYEKWFTEVIGYSVKLILNSAKKIDDYTVEITLNKPDRTFVNHFSARLYIVPEAAYSADPLLFKANPVGTGPYKMVSHQVGAEMRFERFDEYFGGKAPIKDVVVKVIPDSSTITAAMEAGEVDFALVSTASVPTLESADNVYLIERPTTLTWFVTFNTQKAPFDNKLLRQAVAYGMNRQELIDIAFDGIGVATDAQVIEDMPYKPDIAQHYEFNLEKAKELMAQAGYPDGLTIESPMLYFSYQKAAAEVLQAQLAAIGINVTLEGMDVPAAMQLIRPGDYQIAFNGFSLSAIDPDFYLRPLYYSPSINATNMPHYSNPDVDMLIDQAVRELDAAAIRECYNEAYTIIQDEMPLVSLYTEVNMVAVANGLKIGMLTPTQILFNTLEWE